MKLLQNSNNLEEDRFNNAINYKADLEEIWTKNLRKSMIVMQHKNTQLKVRIPSFKIN